MRIIGCSCLLLCVFLSYIESTTYSDLGLPNSDNVCSFASNQSVYFVGVNKTVSITLGNPWYNITPSVDISIPNSISRDISCAITRSNNVVLLSDFQVYKNISLTQQIDSNITFGGSQVALDTFVTKKTPIHHVSSVVFRDFLLIQGGISDQGNLSSTTFILDTRYQNQWTWYELSKSSLAPPPASSIHASLVVTSRWVLYFRTEPVESSYKTFIDCFDPYTFLWLGTIHSINTSTNLIQAVSIKSSIEGSDSLLLVPAWSIDSKINTTAGTTNNSLLWRLDISVWQSNNITTTAVSSNYTPVQGGAIAKFNDDVIVFYGGISPITQQQHNISFFNTTNFVFTPKPQWLIMMTQDNTRNDTLLPIILGSVIGGVLFIAILILFLSLCLRSKRMKEAAMRYEQTAEKRRFWTFDRKNAKTGVLRKVRTLLFSCLIFCLILYTHIGKLSIKSTLSYVLSPIRPTTPINIFPNTRNTENDVLVLEENAKPALFKSRFMEVFHYCPDLKRAKSSYV